LETDQAVHRRLNEQQKGRVVMNLSERVKKIRLGKGLTQVELAKLIGVSGTMITYYETGGSMSYKTMVALCNALDVSPNYLLGVTSPYDGSDLSVSEKEFLAKYRSLPEESQEYASHLIDLIYEIENKSSEKAE